MEGLLRVAGRRHGALRPAQARPQVRRRPPDDLRRRPVAHRARRDPGQAEHRPADRAHRGVRRRQRGRGRRRRLLHGLQGHVPVLRRGRDLRARQRPAAVPARVPPGPARRVLHRPAAAAGGDHAARPGAVGVGRRPPRGALRAARPGRAARRHRGRARAHVQALRALQAPHDAGRLRRLPGRDREGAQGAAPSARPRCPV